MPTAGSCAQPVLIRRVEDSDGKVLYTGADKSHRAVSEATAFLMSSMLADVINAGTAYRARQAGFTLPAAGKTGTTNDYIDAWFVGFTPHLVTGVWVGFDQPQTIVSNGYAGELAVPIWAAFMKVATKGDKPDWFERPSNVVGVNVCRMSGKLPNGGCDNVQVVNRRRAGRKPVDDLHGVLRQGHAADRRSARCIRRRRSSTRSPAVGRSPAAVTRISRCLPRGRPATSGSRDRDRHGGDRLRPMATGGTAEEPKKKRGFWSRVFGGGDEGRATGRRRKRSDKKAGWRRSWR